MPRLGPAFLHRPIEGPSLAQLRNIAAWLLDGLRMLAPAPVKRFRSAPTEERIHIDEDFQLHSHGVVERSLLGVERLDPSGRARVNLPVVATLDTSHIFETSLDLPREARGSLEKTIALRLEDISPIPPAEAAFALGDVTKAQTDRIRAQIAIARKSAVDKVAGLFQDRPLAGIDAESADGRGRYVFKDMSKSDMKRIFHWAAAFTLLWLTVLLFGVAIEHRAERRIAALNEHETALLEAIRHLRAERAALADLQGLTPPAASGADLFRAINDLTTRLPDGALLDSIAYSGGQLELSGLTPSGALADAGLSLRRSKSDFPGYDRFQQATPFPPPETPAP